VIALILILMVGPGAFAMSPEEIRAAIHSQVSQRHPDPPRDFWETLGPEALPVLKQMIEESVSRVERTWLIEGLGHFSDPSVGAILEAKIKDSDNEVFKKKMLQSLIQSQGDSVLDFVEPYLSDKSPHLRIAVAKGIRLYMKSSVASERLKTYLSSEKEEWIRNEIARKDVARVRTPGKVIQEAVVLASPSPEKPLEPLPEKEWSGEWMGVYLSPSGSGTAKAILTRDGTSWRVDLKLPKKSRIELKATEAEVQYFQTDHFHWIRVRDKSADRVFTGNRKAK